ncbi:hypothetical protein GNP61_05295 [Aliivibrio fischeri]|uniref:hypothetical protein n=1 Tax=Aliivibrio fischeri TaxID=668 RepID=UPI0012DADFF9|nr:hypothetical protein [Aliivibrio fischeri]MUK40971.1 hypothetical protein [Aliivibrio fischeri]
MKKTLVPLTALLATMLVGCSGDKTAFNANKISASNFTYTMNELPAVVISLQQDDNNFCEITLLRSDVKQGFSTTLDQKNAENLNASCNINGNYFVQSSKHPTEISIQIDRLDKTKKEAEFKVSLKLINSNNQKNYFEIKDLNFTISKQDFINLTTTPTK